MDDSRSQLGLVLDCAEPEKLAEFWAPALDYVSEAPCSEQVHETWQRITPRRCGAGGA